MTKCKKILLILTILTVCFIWGQSLIPEDMSAQESKTFTETVVKPVQQKVTGSSTVTVDVRKLAHAAEYMVLGLEIMLFVGMRKWLTSFSYCGATALLDETIQLLNDRGALIKDVWIDIAGATVGLLIGAVVLMVIKCITAKAENIKECGWQDPADR